jgi:hypothetical protein
MLQLDELMGKHVEILSAHDIPSPVEWLTSNAAVAVDSNHNVVGKSLYILLHLLLSVAYCFSSYQILLRQLRRRNFTTINRRRRRCTPNLTNINHLTLHMTNVVLWNADRS